MLMKELLIFRTFALFPLIGILIPDIANKLDSPLNSITPEHLIVEITLAICILTCSAGIWVAEQALTKMPPEKNKPFAKTKRQPQLAGNLKKNMRVQALKQLHHLAK
jgi:hypothetical protein